MERPLATRPPGLPAKKQRSGASAQVRWVVALIGVGGLACRRSVLVDENGGRIDDEALAHIWPTQRKHPLLMAPTSSASPLSWPPLDASGYRPCAYPAADRG